MSNIESSGIKNRTLYFGDNLDILRKKFPNEGGYFDLIYLDPPFNSNRDYNQIFEKKGNKDTVAQAHAFEDSWHWTRDTEGIFEELIGVKQSKTDVNQSILDLISGFEKIVGKNDVMAYLVMMTIRLIELHRILKPIGSIYLHCDTTASHYLKIIMDVIFDKKNFKNEIVWRRSAGFKRVTAKKFPVKNDVILFYTNSEDYYFKTQYVPHNPEYLKRFKPDATGKLCRTDVNPTRGGRRTIYLDDVEGNIIDSVWTDINPVNPVAKERLGYQTQKPEKLLERIINTSSKEGDWVLDPFVGCGTCVSVSEKLSRNWVGIDITPLAIDIIKKRLNKEYPKIKIEIDGLPKDMEGAKTLAQKCGTNGRFDFQYWVLSLLNAMPAKGKSKKNKKGKDEGIDGIIKFENQKNEIEKLIISVKSGKNLSVTEIRDLKGVIDREKAVGGLYVTLYEPTKDMEKEAVVAGTYNHFYRDIRKIQIVKVEDLLNSKMPDIPSTISPYKEAEEVKKPEKTTQSKLIKNISSV